MLLSILGVGNRQINRRKPIRLPQSDKRLDEAQFRLLLPRPRAATPRSASRSGKSLTSQLYREQQTFTGAVATP